MQNCVLLLEDGVWISHKSNTSGHEANIFVAIRRHVGAFLRHVIVIRRLLGPILDLVGNKSQYFGVQGTEHKKHNEAFFGAGGGRSEA